MWSATLIALHLVTGSVSATIHSAMLQCAAWQQLGAPAGTSTTPGRPVATLTRDGRVAVFVVQGNHVFEKVQTQPNYAQWSAWADLSTGNSPNVYSASSYVTIVREASGTIDLFVVGSTSYPPGNTSIYMKQYDGTAWYYWSAVPMGSVAPAVGNALAGSLDSGGHPEVYWKYQTNPDTFSTNTYGDYLNSTWNGPNFLGFYSVRSNNSGPTAIRNPNGYAEIFSTDGTTAYRATEATPGTFNSTYSMGTLGGTLGMGPVVPAGPSAQTTGLEVFTVGSDGSVYENWESAANTDTWQSSWLNLTVNNALGSVATGIDSDSSMEVFFIRNSPNLLKNGVDILFYDCNSPYGCDWQGSIEFSDFPSTTQPANATPAVQENYSNGKLSLFVLGADNNLYHRWQSSTENWACPTYP